MPRSPLPSGADVVIVGGGVVGVSAAFHLAEAGRGGRAARARPAGQRLDLEGGGRSARAVLRRAEHRDRQAQPARPTSTSSERPGWEIDYEEIGYLFVLTTETGVEAFDAQRGAAERARRAVADITPEEAREICPLLAGEDILAAGYCPTDAHATPESVVQGYAFGAREHGAHLAVSTPVEGIDVAGGTITARAHAARDRADRHGHLRRGRLVARVRRVGRRRARRHAAAPPGAVHRADGRPAGQLPLTIDFATGFYFHREGRGLLMGMADPNETPGFQLRRPTTGSPGCSRSPSGARRGSPRAPIQGGWAGLYDMSPDHNAMIGEAKERLALPLRHRLLRPRLPAGPGDRRDPARPRASAGAPFVDVTPLSADRFDGGTLAPEFHVV